MRKRKRKKAGIDEKIDNMLKKIDIMDKRLSLLCDKKTAHYNKMKWTMTVAMHNHYQNIQDIMTVEMHIRIIIIIRLGKGACARSVEGGASASTIGKGARARLAKQTRTTRCRRISRSFRLDPNWLELLPLKGCILICNHS